MKIALDIMGGDFIPRATVFGGLDALEIISDLQLFLVGDPKAINEEIDVYIKTKNIDSKRLVIIPATEYIQMDENPIKAFTEKPKSSMFTCFNMVSSNEVDVMASAGNSGAMMTGAHLVTKVIPHVSRPCLGSVVPTLNNYNNLLLDVGVNIDSKPDLLVEFAILGHLYQKYVQNITNPKVALLNIGEEDNKGNKLCKEAFPLLQNCSKINFVGNVESRDLFKSEIANVFVCDGFVGNMIIKVVEGVFHTAEKQTQLNDIFMKKTNYENYGGMPILGINKNVVLGHGISNQNAICNMVKSANKIAEVNLAQIIIQSFSS